MNYAVIKSGGKQYKVTVGDILEIDRLSKKDGDVSFEEVLLLSSEGNVRIGKPFLPGVSVHGKIIETKRGEKIRVAKFKAKARYRRVTGFRAELSVVKIDKIETGKKEKASKILKSA